MATAPRVSVVIPTYNSRAFVAFTIESVRAQTFADWEAVLSDDGSSDGSVGLAEEFARRDPRIRVVMGAHGGISSARNQGFRATYAGSEFVTFLDSDDTWEPEALAMLVGALEAHPECPGAHGLARAVDPQGRHIEGDDLMESMRHRREIRGGHYVDLPVTAPTSFHAELVQNYVVTPGTSLIRRRVLESLGGFESTVDPCEDWDMNLRITRRGGFALVDRVILNWRRHPHSISNTTGRRWRRSYLAVRKRTILSGENTAEQREAAEFALLTQCRAMRAAAGQELKLRRPRSAARDMLRALPFYLAFYQVRFHRLMQR